MPKIKSIPPIYFTAIELENVRCFGRRQVLDLTHKNGQPAQWTLILGDNGVGKSTLLQCLAWMRPVPELPEDFEGDNEDEALTIGEIVPALSNEENHILEALLRSGPKVELNLKTHMRQYQKLNSAGGEQKEITTGISISGKKGLLKEFHLTDNSRIEDIGEFYGEPPIFAYGANRQVGSENLTKSDLDDPIASRLSDMTELYDADEILSDLDHAAAKKRYVGQANERLKKVKRILIKILPHVKDIIIFGPNILDMRDEGDKSGVRFKTPYGLVPLRSLSLGYQTTLAWAVDLAWRLFRRYPKSPKPLEEPAIVLVDEIDLHLHPLWQRTIVADLTRLFPQTQFIATAHSPLIVQSAATANIAVLRQERDHVVIENDPLEIMGWRVDQILTSELFGVPDVRGKETESLIKRRDALLDKIDRTPAEEARLKRLEEKLANLPTVGNKSDREAMELIRQAASLLKNPRGRSA